MPLELASIGSLGEHLVVASQKLVEKQDGQVVSCVGACSATSMISIKDSSASPDSEDLIKKTGIPCSY